MKRAVKFAINSVMLFWAYFLMSFFVFLVLQTPLRALGVAAGSKGEYLWKTIANYAVMVVVCVGHFLLRNTGEKVKYFSYMDDRPWNLKTAARYVIKNPDFWSNSLGFALWPVIFSKYFTSVSRLYVSKEFLESFPTAILTVLTVDVPFVLLSFASWLAVLYHWSTTRMHKPH